MQTKEFLIDLATRLRDSVRRIETEVQELRQHLDDMVQNVYEIEEEESDAK